MSLRLFKYFSPSLLYAGALAAFAAQGFAVWLPLVYAWVVIPVLELFIRPDATNLSAAEEEMAKKARWYDYLLYAIVPLQYIALAVFLYNVTFVPQPWTAVAGKTAVMGLLCGTFGINVGHELGHRSTAMEKFFAKALLLTSLYLHFFIEHNKGHHKRVATPHDPSSARFGESLYAFFLRSIINSYRSAWHIANRDARKKSSNGCWWQNEMVYFHLAQMLFLSLILFVFGPMAMLLFAAAALQGILLLETVNYIEHYGLQRRQLAEGRYERALPVHSWNSDHVIGRVMLFELSRHSDHHYLASRKYQVLRHHNDSPQMPTGYPGMMLLALVPPLWFRVMNKRVRQLQNSSTAFSGAESAPALS